MNKINKAKIPERLDEQIEAMAHQLIADVSDAYERGEEIEAFRALERLRMGVEALVRLAEIDDYLRGE